ncbi:metalloregulator ArsR/SmtB family transcription factor [soil metagenome]
MVQYQPQLDGTLSALADPTRRAILDHLRQGNATITELAGPIGISLTAVKKQVAILEGAELVRTEKVGRSRHCSLVPRPLDEISEWVESYRRGWEDRFDRLDEVIRNKQKEPAK